MYHINYYVKVGLVDLVGLASEFDGIIINLCDLIHQLNKLVRMYHHCTFVHHQRSKEAREKTLHGS